MHVPIADHQVGANDGYITGRTQAWFAFAMTFALMLFDYIDRQVIVSLFPHLKQAWNLSDKQLGGLVSIISVVVALGGLPVALFADRFSRVKSVFVMGAVWSLATVSCMFATSYTQMFAARAMVGAGEAGYGSVGAALIATLFPKRLRSTLLGALFAASSFGAVLGVLLGGIIAAHWGWRAAFGVVGIPGIIVSCLYLLVRDYKTVSLSTSQERGFTALKAGAGRIVRGLTSSRTVWWTCVGTSLQVVIVSTVWAWLPSYLMRFQGYSGEQAAKQAALVVLLGGLGTVFWGYAVDLCAVRRARNKLLVTALLCLLTFVVLVSAFSGKVDGFLPIAVGGFCMACTGGVGVGVVLDIMHPALRSTAGAMLSLFQNLFGLAVGPFVAGILSDMYGLQKALEIMPFFGVAAALCYVLAARSYESDLQAVVSATKASELEPGASALAGQAG
ncbi:MFS transporter [Cupriavidus sp. BIS7]|uniref:MFS transporter n=1 Tax=Cupriavidus sp. BIS7 TaxID=1217718 RepID=UPI0002E3F625|nr:MFS transporter [Cupriavidus sp. BIS7]